METLTTITRNTELKAKDLIKSPGGEIFKINSIFGSKNNFQIYSMKNPSNEINPLFLFITKESMILKGWQKLEDEKAVKLSNKKAA